MRFRRRQSHSSGGAAVGRYGGRFVLGETNNPRTFNAMMANETSSTDITDRLFGFLVDFNLATQSTNRAWRNRGRWRLTA